MEENFNLEELVGMYGGDIQRRPSAAEVIRSTALDFEEN